MGLRQSSGQRVIPRGGGVLRLFKTVACGRHVAILTDLTIPAQLPTVAIDCFGMKTSVTFAHAWAHRKAGATIIPVHCEPLLGGRYRIVFHRQMEFPAAATFQEMTQACWDRFEPVVRANPAPWLWMYKHWRYRPAGRGPGGLSFLRECLPGVRATPRGRGRSAPLGARLNEPRADSTIPIVDKTRAMRSSNGNYAIPFPPLFLPLRPDSFFPDELRNHEDRFDFRKLSGHGVQAEGSFQSGSETLALHSERLRPGRRSPSHGCPGHVGKPGSVTPSGKFTIYNKIKNKRRISQPDAGYPMAYWCEFKPAYGFHEGFVHSTPAHARLHPPAS